MLNLQIAICDDEKEYRHQLTSHLDSYLVAKDVNITYHEFSSGEELIKNYQTSGKYQILFLDVEMPGINGLQLAEIIKKTIDRHVYIVFISNYPHYMQDSFRTHPFYYLVKPVTLDKFYWIMDEIVREINEEHVLYTLIQTNSTEKTVNIRDILYIDVSNGKKGMLCFHFFKDMIETKGKISDWTAKLQDLNFYPCYRGILVNMIHIHYFEKNSIILDNGESIPLNRSCGKSLRELYLNNIVKLKNLS